MPEAYAALRADRNEQEALSRRLNPETVMSQTQTQRLLIEKALTGFEAKVGSWCSGQVFNRGGLYV